MEERKSEHLGCCCDKCYNVTKLQKRAAPKCNPILEVCHEGRG